MKELTIKEAIKVLNVSERTIRRMIKRGDLPNAQKRDRKILIPQSDIDAYLRKQQEEASAPKIESAPKPKPKSKPKSKPKPKPKSKPKPPLKEAKIEPEPAPLVEAEPELRPSEPEVIPTPVEVPEPEPEPLAAEEPAKFAPEEAPPEKEPEPAIPPTAELEQGQAAKEFFVKAGITSLNWLEKNFKKMRDKLEEYKDRVFPD
jgi:excisionase family DNA binding protein